MLPRGVGNAGCVVLLQIPERMKRTFSKEEAQQIFAAAADRQQAEHRETGERLTLEELEEAAAAAGINSKHVLAAAEDLVLLAHAGTQRRVLGLPVESSRSITLSHAVDDPEWGLIVEELRAVFKKRGIATEVGAVREWASESDDRRSPVRVTAAPAGEGTRLTFERSRWNQVAGLGGGALSLILTAALLAVIASVGGETDLLLPIIIMSIVGALFSVGVAVGTRASATRDEARFDEAVRRIRQIGEKRATGAPSVGESAGREAAPERTPPIGNPPIADRIMDQDEGESTAGAAPADVRSRTRRRSQ